MVHLSRGILHRLWMLCRYWGTPTGGAGVVVGLMILLPLVQAGIDSMSLRQQSTQHQAHYLHPRFSMEHLLFWSSFQCNLDAATLNLGPIDIYLRGGGSTAEEQLNNHYHDNAFENDEDDDTPRAIHVSRTKTTTTTSTTTIGYGNGTSLETDKEILPPRIRILDAPSNNTAETENGESQQKSKKWKWRRGRKSEEEKSEPTTPKQSYRFSLFQKGDGSETDPDGIPTRYINMHPNRRDMSLKSLQSTLEWREKENIDSILASPQPKFDICKSVFPHYFLGRDVNRRVVFIQRPALLDLDKAAANGLDKFELLRHYIYVNEYLWQIVEAHDPLATMTSVIDLTGLRFSVLRKTEIISFLQTFVSTMDSHYPQRAHRTLVLNAPGWFNAMYQMVSPLMRETTKSKIQILSKGKQQDEAMEEYLGPEITKLLPPLFQSDGPTPTTDEELYQPMPEECRNTDLEQQLRAFTMARLEDAGEEMQPVV